MPKFAPCPVCKKTQVKVLRAHYYGFTPMFHVTCSICGCESDDCETKEEAINNWNTLSERYKDPGERYYSLSLLKSLAFDDDVNGKCDGTIDFTVVDCLSGANVRKDIVAEWENVVTLDDISDFGTCISRTFQTCSNCNVRTGFDGRKDEIRDNFCPVCGATMKHKEKNKE